jgi:hypothetical protein
MNKPEKFNGLRRSDTPTAAISCGRKLVEGEAEVGKMVVVDTFPHPKDILQLTIMYRINTCSIHINEENNNMTSF